MTYLSGAARPEGDDVLLTQNDGIFKLDSSGVSVECKPGKRRSVYRYPTPSDIAIGDLGERGSRVTANLAPTR